MNHREMLYNFMLLRSFKSSKCSSSMYLQKILRFPITTKSFVWIFLRVIYLRFPSGFWYSSSPSSSVFPKSKPKESIQSLFKITFFCYNMTKHVTSDIGLFSHSLKSYNDTGERETAVVIKVKDSQ